MEIRLVLRNYVTPRGPSSVLSTVNLYTAANTRTSSPVFIPHTWEQICFLIWDLSDFRKVGCYMSWNIRISTNKLISIQSLVIEFDQSYITPSKR